MQTHMERAQHTQQQQHYGKLVIMAVLSFASMYVLMYSMVDTFASVLPNVNQFYMAGLMTMLMIIIEIFVMSSMYMDKKRNALIIAESAVTLVAFFFFIRQQTAVSDKQYLKSMIPHHAGAILMAGQANLRDPELKKLGEKIIADQRAEIAQMKAKLKALDQ